MLVAILAASMGFMAAIEVHASTYLTTAPKIVKIVRTTDTYKDEARTHRAKVLHAGDFAHIATEITLSGKVPVLETTSKTYLTANTAYVAKSNGYQNPKKYYQVQYQQIKPYGTVGYTVKRNYEGIKTWTIMRKMHTYAGCDKYNQATYTAVKAFQKKHGLPMTGNVNEATWVKMGFSKSSWTSVDDYVAPLAAQAWNGRSAHITAMINQAYRYLGNPYLVGSSSSPKYGTDCSGLVMQALYAGGIDPLPVSAIHHAYPGNEWNSRNLFAAKKLKSVSYAHRQRGDLIFYYQPGTHTVWHVALYLGHNQVIESWPPKTMIRPVKDSQRSIIAGVKRPFL